MNLVHSDRLHAAQFAVRQAVLNKPVDRTIDCLPTGLEGARGFSPTEPSRPARQKTHHGAGHRTLALRPGNVLDDAPLLGTLHPPWRVAEKGGDAPQGNKQPAPLG